MSARGWSTTRSSSGSHRFSSSIPAQQASTSIQQFNSAVIPSSQGMPSERLSNKIIQQEPVGRGFSGRTGQLEQQDQAPLAQRIAVHILVDVHPPRHAIEAIAAPFQRLPSATRPAPQAWLLAASERQSSAEAEQARRDKYI